MSECGAGTVHPVTPMTDAPLNGLWAIPLWCHPRLVDPHNSLGDPQPKLPG